MMRGAKEGYVTVCCFRRCDIICAAKVRICVECAGGSDECSRMDRTGGSIWCG